MKDVPHFCIGMCMNPKARTMDNTPLFANNCNNYMAAITECNTHKGSIKRHQL